MVITNETLEMEWTPAALQARFGAIPLWRIVTDPPPGCATEDDVDDLFNRSKALCELVDGVLVRKTVGSYESYLAFRLGTFLNLFVMNQRPAPGWVLGADGMLRLWPGRIRIPDVCFISAKQPPDGRFPRDQRIASLFPDLAVEVLSPSNTPREMADKLADYFQSGTRLVWLIDPATKSAEVYTAIDQKQVVPTDGALIGEPVLPGLEIRLADIFESESPTG
jgi:Uma2 family endonuclease